MEVKCFQFSQKLTKCLGQDLETAIHDGGLKNFLEEKICIFTLSYKFFNGADDQALQNIHFYQSKSIFTIAMVNLMFQVTSIFCLMMFTTHMSKKSAYIARSYIGSDWKKIK